MLEWIAQQVIIGVSIDHIRDRLRPTLAQSRSIIECARLPGSVQPPARLTIDPAGNVGIGTTRPGAKLEINDGDLLFKAKAGGEDPGDIIFQNAGGTQKGRIWTNPAAGAGLCLSSGDNVPDIAIDAAGRVGIGTENPNYRLSFGSNLANTKLAIWDGGANGAAFGLGVQGGQFRFHLNQASDRFSFLNGANGTELVTISGGGNVGIGTTTLVDKLNLAGIVRILTESNPIRFTSGWTGFPDNVTNQAEISNDTVGHKTLMIVGNRSAGLGRRVSVWDRLEVNGTLHVKGNDGVLNIEGTNCAYVQWYLKGLAATRKAWMGYGSSGTDELTIRNDAGKVTISGSELTVGCGATIKGSLTVENWLIVNGTDFVLKGRGGGQNRNGNHEARALVDNGPQGGLVVNFNQDFGFTEIQGPFYGDWKGRMSDVRLKANIAPLGSVLDKIDCIRPVYFDWTEEANRFHGTDGQRNLGVIAQEVQAVFPEMVSTYGSGGYKVVNYSQLTAVLLAAVQELKGSLNAALLQIGQHEVNAR